MNAVGEARASFRALVVGAGIGGLAAAIALRRAGVDVHVFERADAIREVGAGISLWANALRALERLGVKPAIDAHSTPYDVAGIRTADGSILSQMSIEELHALLGTPVIIMHRADLLAALLAAVPAGDITFGAACTRTRDEGDQVEIGFADGRTATGDVLIGADGLHSTVRAALHGEQRPRYSGCTAWRAVVPFDATRVRAGETWGGGSLFGLVPISGSRVYWYAARNLAEGGQSPRPKAELLEHFGRWHAPIGALIEAADEGAILRNDIYDRPALRQWGRGRTTLLGDAAHPMAPFLGQGACQALEDAVMLGECVARGGAPASVLRVYEQRRIPRANAFVARSRVAGQIARLSNPVLVAIRNAALKRVSPTRQARQLAAFINAAT